MSKFTDSLRELRIFNEHGFFAVAGDHVWIDYTPVGRGGRAAHWQVHRYIDGRMVKTDPDGHWRDSGRKTFTVGWRETRADALKEAQAWCAERFGITEWARSPFGGYGDARFVKARTKELRAQLRALSLDAR